MLNAEELLKRYPSLNRLMFRSGRKRVPVVRQLAATDCGAASLAMVLAYYGKIIPIEDIRIVLGIGRNGSNAEAILLAGRAYGLRSRGVRAEIEALDDLPAGAVLHWEFRHFVVFERLLHNKVYIVDPAVGRRVIPLEHFRKSFTGVALIFEPTESFEPGGKKPKRIGGLLQQVLERKDLLGQIVSTSLLVQILSAALPLFIGILIDRVVPRKDYSLLLILTLGFCLFQAFSLIAAFLRTHLFIHLRAQLEARFTFRFLDHLVNLPYSYFQQHTSGDLMVRLDSNSNIREILTTTTLSAVMDGAMASIYMAFLLLASFRLSVFVLIMAASRFLALVWLRWRQKQLLSESINNASQSSTAQIELLSGMETLKAMGLEQRAAENWSNVFVDGLNISIKRGRLDAVYSTLLGLLGGISTLGLIFYGTYLVLEARLTLGEMMAFSALATGFLTPLTNLVTSALQLQILEVYLERLNDVMETPPEQGNGPVHAVAPLTGNLVLENVSFRYNVQDPLVVRDISFEVAPGMRIALVGRTGSGKSTLARLLAGLYQPVQGRILFDGKDLKNLNLRSVRRQLGIVTQETQLFGGSIRHNIALSNPQMGLERVILAAKLAEVHDEIEAMSLGYETPLIDRGLSLSGGQRQRLAIARALAANPRILILDEATSQLDTVTEWHINENLAALRCTRVVIAHRLSTIRSADLILVLDSGVIVEQGTHDYLLATRGVYAGLAEPQEAKSLIRDEGVSN